MQDIHVSWLAQAGGRVERVKRRLDVIHRVVEVEHEGIGLAQLPVAAVEAGQRLHGQNALQLLVHVHGVQHGFVEAGQVLVGNHQNLGIVLLEFIGQVTRRKTVQRLFGVLDAIHHLFAGERHQRLEGRIGLFQSSAYGKEVADGAFDIARHHHGLGFALQLLGLPYAGREVIDHDLGLHLNGPWAGFYKCFELLLGLGGIEQRVVLHRLLYLVVALVRGVLFQHVEDELLLDGLLHGIQVEGVELAI